MTIKKYFIYYIVLISTISSAMRSQSIRDFEKFEFARMQQERAVPSQSVKRSAELTEPGAQSLEDFENTDDASGNKKFEDFEDFENFKEFEDFIDLSPAQGSDQSTSMGSLQDALALINQKVIENLKKNAALQQPADTGLSKIQKTKKMPARQKIVNPSSSQMIAQPLGQKPTASTRSNLGSQQAAKKTEQNRVFQFINFNKVPDEKDYQFIDESAGEVKSFKCPECGKLFPTQRGLSTHKTVVHKSKNITPETMSAQYQ